MSRGAANRQALREEQVQGGQLQIRGDACTVSLADIGKVTGTQRLQASWSPQTIAITDADGPRQGQICLGL